MTTRTDALHDALDRLSAHQYVDGPGMAVHGPMGAEALSSLGFDQLVPSWVSQYVSGHPPIDAPPTHVPIDPDHEPDWRAALGDFSRVSDWSQLFVRQLADEPSEQVLARWVPRLLPGYAGGLTHGLLRTAHAVRMIDGAPDPSPAFLGELASGLASWAGWYLPLPGYPGLTGPLSVGEAVSALPVRPEPWTPLEAGTFARLGEVAEFPAGVDRLGPPGAGTDALADLSASACRLMLANDGAPPIGLVHAITPIAAMRTLLPLGGDVTVTDAYRRLWHVMAGLTMGFADRRTTTIEGIVDLSSVPTPSALAERAAGHPDAHVVKLTEACLREHANQPDDVYLLAAGALIDRLGRLSQ